MVHPQLTIGRLALLALVGATSACTVFPRMDVRYTLPNEGKVSQIVQSQWMNSKAALRSAVQAAIAQAQVPGETSARDLQALGFVCSDEPAAHCVHQSSLRYRITPAPAAANSEQTMTFRISALREGQHWRVDVAIACGAVGRPGAEPGSAMRLSTCNDDP